MSPPPAASLPGSTLITKGNGVRDVWSGSNGPSKRGEKTEEEEALFTEKKGRTQSCSSLWRFHPKTHTLAHGAQGFHKLKCKREKSLHTELMMPLVYEASRLSDRRAFSRSPPRTIAHSSLQLHVSRPVPETLLN